MRCILLSLVLLVSAPLSASDWSKADTAAVRNVLDQYVTAWLAGDPAAVMRQLTADSVLIPGDKTPYVGADAIRSYWWPAGSPPFALRRFDTTIDQIDGTADLAIVRGSQVIEWSSGQERWRAKGNYLTVLRRTKDGWRIATQMAANAQNERLP